MSNNSSEITHPPQPTPKKRTYRRVSKATLLEQIEKKHGNISLIASGLGVNRSHLHARINQDPDLLKALADEREGLVDNAEYMLGKAVTNGEAWAVCFTLKTIGRSRGYIERQVIEHQGNEEKPLQFKIRTADEIAASVGIALIEDRSIEHIPASSEAKDIVLWTPLG